MRCRYLIGGLHGGLIKLQTPYERVTREEFFDALLDGMHGASQKTYEQGLDLLHQGTEIVIEDKIFKIEIDLA